MKQQVTRIDLGGVNCYLVKGEDGFILIDTGGHLIMDKKFDNRRSSLEIELEKAGCMPGNLKLIILTHGDSDHTANASYLREKYNARIAMHRGDLKLVEDTDLDMAMESFRYRSLVFKVMFLFLKPTIRRITIRVLEDFEKFTPDLYIDEGSDLSEFGLDAKVLHLPGHTGGSVGILSKDGCLICGDIFVNMGKPSTAPNAADFRKLGESVDRLRQMDIKEIYPGHGVPYVL